MVSVTDTYSMTQASAHSIFPHLPLTTVAVVHHTFALCFDAIAASLAIWSRRSGWPSVLHVTGMIKDCRRKEKNFVARISRVARRGEYEITRECLGRIEKEVLRLERMSGFATLIESRRE